MRRDRTPDRQGEEAAMNAVATVVVGHGSRVPESNRAFLDFVKAARARAAGMLEGAFIELAEPTIPQALEVAVRAGAREVIVAPFLLLAAGHAKSDIPLHIAAARARFPDIRFTQAAPLGVHPLMVEILSDRVAQTIAAAPRRRPADTALLLLGRGSSDPDANSDLYKLARLLWEGRGFAAVDCAFCGVVGPTLEQALRKLARSRPRRIVVVPYLFFAGLLVQRMEAAAASFQREFPWIEVLLAPPLGNDPRLLDLIFTRVREAREGLTRMSCDLCKYKVRLAGFEEEVGGEKALLRSLQHAGLSTALESNHAHGPIRKHLLVCVNSECVSQGSAALLAALRLKLKERGLDRMIQTTKTSCLRRCGDGPLLVVYPDGVWYRSLKPSDLDEVIEQHLCANRPVGRLLDQIMTI
jgi:sirohydrochlorin cobaltochelatase